MKYIYVLATACFLLTGITYLVDSQWGWGIASLIFAVGLAVLSVIEFRKPTPVEFTASVAETIPDPVKARIAVLKKQGDSVAAIKLLRESVPGLSLVNAKDAVDRFF